MRDVRRVIDHPRISLMKLRNRLQNAHSVILKRAVQNFRFRSWQLSLSSLPQFIELLANRRSLLKDISTAIASELRQEIPARRPNKRRPLQLRRIDVGGGIEIGVNI